MIESLRTPDARFDGLVDFNYKSHYINDFKGFESLRMHFLDEGPKDSETTFLCLHGQPTWSYLYRKMIKVFISNGFRAVAPDFFGFGKSDKPIKDETYTFNFHLNSLIKFIKTLDLKDITLVCQDWGGILGLTLPHQMSDRFSRLIVMNTTLGTGDYELTHGFLDFRAWVNKTPDMNVGRLMKRAVPDLTEEELKAYDAPFPEKNYKAGVRRFPNLVPDTPDAEGAKISREARNWLGSEWQGETFMAVGMLDPVLGVTIMRQLRKWIKNCPKPLYLKNTGHFVQESGDVVAIEALKHFKLI